MKSSIYIGVILMIVLSSCDSSQDSTIAALAETLKNDHKTTLIVDETHNNSFYLTPKKLNYVALIFLKKLKLPEKNWKM